MNHGGNWRTYRMSMCKPYPNDVTDGEWQFVAPYLTLLPLAAKQRRHDLREIFNALRNLVRVSCPWWMLPNDLSPGRWCIARPRDC